VLTLHPYDAYRGSAEVLNTGMASADSGGLRRQLFERVPIQRTIPIDRVKICCRGEVPQANAKVMFWPAATTSISAKAEDRTVLVLHRSSPIRVAKRFWRGRETIVGL